MLNEHNFFLVASKFEIIIFFTHTREEAINEVPKGEKMFL